MNLLLHPNFTPFTNIIILDLFFYIFFHVKVKKKDPSVNNGFLQMRGPFVETVLIRKVRYKFFSIFVTV